MAFYHGYATNISGVQGALAFTAAPRGLFSPTLCSNRAKSLQEKG